MNKKCILSCLLLTVLLGGCTDPEADEPGRKTNSGYVAFDFTCHAFRQYAPILNGIYRFNEYIKQPTLAQRDSVDRLFFRNVKIFYDTPNDLWTLMPVQASLQTDFSALSIRTNGQALDEPNARWSVLEAIVGGYSHPTSFAFDVENKGDRTWYIPLHDNATGDGLFEYAALDWEIRFKDDGKGCVVKGGGTLVSIASPKLKLEYVITVPLEIAENRGRLAVSSGVVRILATDVDKSLTEEISVYILSAETIEVAYGNHVERWDYIVF
jgi:hypothetical protein